jgi:hypothetical protein
MSRCVATLGRAFALFSTTLPYQSDMRNLATRGAAATDTSKITEDESLDLAQLRGGGDCEDLARLIYMHMKMLGRGRWEASFLRTAQRLVGYYEPVMMLGSVKSPALGNDHDAAKTAAHLADARHHHHVLTTKGGVPDTHMTRSDAVVEVHKYTRIDSVEEMALEVGGHSWAEMIPKRKFSEFIARLVPQTRDAAVSPLAAAADAVHNVPACGGWEYYLPHLVLEGTGRLNPLLMPEAYYATPGEHRDAIRQRSLGAMATFHALISSPLFHSLQSEAQPTATVNTPGYRLTDFYVQSTQVFTDAYLDKTGTASFNWVQLGPSASPLTSLEHADAEGADPLFERSDALSAERVEKAVHSFTHSAAVAEATVTSNAAKALSIANHELELQTLAVGSLVGEAGVTRVDAALLTLGVDLEQRIQDRPYAANVALVPVGALTPLEARILDAQMRQLSPDEPPSGRLSMFAAAVGEVEFVRQSQTNPLEATPDAVARLCAEPTLVAAQRKRVAALDAGVRELFADRPWLGDAEAHAEGLHLHTFFFRPHELVSDNGATAVKAELQRMRTTGLVHVARFYVEEPTLHFKTCVLQVLAKEPLGSKDL